MAQVSLTEAMDL